jgi:hypothetical protein
MFRRFVVRRPTVPVIALHLERRKCAFVPTVTMDGSHTVRVLEYHQIAAAVPVRLMSDTINCFFRYMPGICIMQNR